MHSSQWLYNSPVFPDSLHWSEHQLLLVNVGSTVVIADPYSLQTRGYFSTPRGLDQDSGRTGASSQNGRIGTLQLTLDTIKEFVKHDSGWVANIRASCWAPKSVQQEQPPPLLAVLQSDNKVLIYGLPTCTTSEVSLVADLTQSLENCVRKSEDWNRLISSRTVLRLRGGGRNGREPLVDKSTSESKQLIREYQLPEDLDPSLVPSLDAGDSNRFRIDLPKVVLSLWLELRSQVPKEELPKYRKGDQLFGIDRQMYEKVMSHVKRIYRAEISLHGVDQKFLETRSRSMIRKKAIVSFDTTIWRGNKFLPSESVLSLIGQGARQESMKSIRRPAIVSNHEAALLVQETNKTVRLVKRQSGQKRKSETEDFQTDFQDTVFDQEQDYGLKLRLMSPLSIAWSPVVHGENWRGSVLAIGLKSGHLALCQYPHFKEQNPVDDFHFTGLVSAMESEITVLKWKEYRSEDNNQKVLFLLTGDVSGSVKLWILNPAFHLIGGHAICRQDDRPVYCAHMGITKHHNSPQLIISVGKSSGSFAVWQSPVLTDLSQDLHWFSDWTDWGEVYWEYYGHHCQTITGISYTPFLDLIITVGLDSQVQSWRIQEGEIQPAVEIQDCPGIQPIYGLATSPSGMMLAVVKDLGEKFSDAQVHRMAWQRVASGSINLIRLLDLQNRTSWQQGIDHLRTLFNEDDQNLSALAVDVGFFIKWFCLGSQEDLDEEEYKSEQDKRITTAIQFLKVVFDLLDSEVKCQMQAYNALYYTLKEITQLQIDGSRVQSMELKLLEDYVQQVLDLDDEGLMMEDSMVTEFGDRRPLETMKESMIEWILNHPSVISETLFERALGFKKDDFCPVENVDAITAATRWKKEFGNCALMLDRCYVTFLKSEKITPWKCVCCGRCCLVPYSRILKLDRSICLFCGTHLTCTSHSVM